MRLTQTFALMAAIATIAVTYSGCSKKEQPLKPPGGIGILNGSVADSPMMASGGSMDFRSLNGGWSCTSSTTCTSNSRTIDTTKVAFVELDSSSGTVPPGVTVPAGQTWIIDLYARDATGHILSAGNHVEICPLSPSGGSCGAAGSTGVMITATGATLGNEIDLDDNGVVAKRYEDNNTCNIGMRQGCEHVGKVAVSINGSPATNYTCHHGHCEIRVG